ncbi:hypothetical protein FOCC_FOCC005325 [Frankliniella occidentalis]|nr:hypothetical protein FOCC_FOCC005325 [Frankliniella occidentalis]
MTNVLHKFSSEEDISPKPTGHMQQQQPPQQQQQQQQQPPQKQHSRHAQPHAQHASKQPAPRLRSEPNVGAVTEAARTQAHQSNGGSPMTSVRPSPVGTPYGTPYSNQSQSPVGSGTEWSSNHHHSPVSKHQPAKAKPVDAHQEARTQSSRKYAETRVGDKAVSQSSPRSPAVTSRSRTSSTDSLILSMSTEELQDSGESVVTTRLQIPVNKVADTIQRYQAHTQAHSQGQDIVIEQRSPSVSPNPGNVLRKSESWHQLAAQTQGLPVKGSGRAEGRPLSMHGGNGQDLPPAAPARSPGLAKAKSSHSLAFPKQFEAAIKPDALQVKQKTVEQYFKKADSTAGDGFGSGPKSASVNVKQQYSKKSQQSSLSVSTRKTSQTYEPLTPVEVLLVDDNLENVDEAFESLFAASVGSDGRTLSGKANYKQRRLSNKPKLGGYSANVTRTSSVQGGSAIKSSK